MVLADTHLESESGVPVEVGLDLLRPGPRAHLQHGEAVGGQVPPDHVEAGADQVEPGLAAVDGQSGSSG